MSAPFWWPLVSAIATAISAAIIRSIEKKNDRKRFEKEQEEKIHPDSSENKFAPADKSKRNR